MSSADKIKHCMSKATEQRRQRR